MYQFRKRISYVKVGYMNICLSVTREVRLNSLDCLTDGVNSQRASAHRSITLLIQWNFWNFKKPPVGVNNLLLIRIVGKIYEKTCIN
jgi:hypothetical protein